MSQLSQYGVRSLEELDSKDWGNYFLSKDITGLTTSPSEAAQKLVENVNLIDQYVIEMNRVREEHREATQRSLASLREKRRTERMFQGKFKQLVRKPEFKSRVCEMKEFTKTAPLDLGPHMEPWEKLALITPSRAYEKGLQWKPVDDVPATQKHVYFDSTLPSVSTKSSLRRIPNRLNKA